MATTTTSRSKKKSSSSSKSSSRSGGSSKTKKTKTQPGIVIRLLRSFGEHLGDQSSDVYGIGLILFGVLSTLAVVFQAAGPVGDLIEATVRGLFGVYGYAVPPLLIYFGVLVVMDRPGKVIGRVAIGLAITLLAAIGGWHMLAGAPVPADGFKQLWPAGGLLGWGISTPLRAALSVWGASAVFLAMLFLGILIVTKTPFRAVIDAVAHLFHPGENVPPPQPTSETATPAPVGEDGLTDEERATVERAEKRGKRGKKKDEPAAEAPVIASGEGEVGPRADERNTPGVPAPGNAYVEKDSGDGLTDADREAGRAPAPPRATVGDTGEATPVKKATKIAPFKGWEDYELPPLDLLQTGKSMQKASQRHIEAQVDALQETFDQFGIDATVARWSRGPTVTRFEIELGPGVQVKKVGNMGDDIAYALAAPDVRIVAPIPGKSAIGVEVPNRERDLITLGDILSSNTAQSEPHPLFVAVGVDIAGNPALVNLATMPHLLVSGATGSGKSVTLNAMITSVIMRARPDQCRMVLVDPKRVELNHYDGAPHLLSPVITDPKRAADALEWAVKEMEMRYETLARLGYRNIDNYNDAVAKGELSVETEEEREAYRHMPYILIVIDELADLMLVAPRDVEEAICRLAQMARAVGIHMVIATQRPSVDVITGLIKANIPSRLALAVASQTDSRTILDQAGAEKLVGHGDLLFLPASQGKPSRLQGCFVSEKEIDAVIKYCKSQREAEYVKGVVKEGTEAVEIDRSRGSDDDSDETLVRLAAEQVVESGLGSTSMLQRKLRIGFARAGRIMDELEQMGVVGPNEGSKAREVLWSEEHLENAVQQGLF